jgi:hypothetical protein
VGLAAAGTRQGSDQVGSGPGALVTGVGVTRQVWHPASITPGDPASQLGRSTTSKTTSGVVSPFRAGAVADGLPDPGGAVGRVDDLDAS